MPTACRHPHWPSPTSSRFNQRVHARVDPWFEQRWVRRLAWLGWPASLFFAAVWIYFATGLPTSESCWPTSRRCRPTCAAMTAIRSRPSPASGGSSWPIDEYPPLVVNAFISAEDKTFFSHGGIDYPGLVGAVFDYSRQGGHRRPRARRLDHHPAGRQISAPGHSYSVGRKIREAILAFRLESTLSQAADPRALPQFDLPRPQRLWRAGREPRLFRQGRQRTDAARGGLSRGPAQGAVAIMTRCARPQKALARRNYVLREMAANGYITDGAVARGGRDPARHDPLRQQREVPRAGRLFHGRGPPRPDQAVRRKRRGRARTASTPAACGCAPRWIR